MFYILFQINENIPNLQQYVVLYREEGPGKYQRGSLESQKKNHLKYSLEISFKIGIVFYEMGTLLLLQGSEGIYIYSS